MKFLCSNCKAKYQIADEKVAGRTLRMTCRQCKQEIVIRGDAPARASLAAPVAPPPAPSPLGADFQRQLGGGMRPSLAPPPPLLDAWHVAINDVPVGPMRREDVARRIASGAVGPESLAWREGLDDWLPVRQIPELAALLGTSLPAPAPFVPAMPAQRADVAPLGGRAGAAPAFTLEDWAPSAPSQEPISALRAAPAVVEADRDRDRDRDRGFRMSGGMMFAIACAFAFSMSALTILGVRLLSRDDAQVAQAPPAVTVVNTPPATAAQEHAPREAEPSEMVIELDDIGVEGSTASAKPKPTTKAPATTTTAKPKDTKPQLTDAEREMLARMGAGSDTAIGNLGTSASSAPKRNTGGGNGLTADQLSKVVNQGRKNLQRCYETALRGAGSDSTIRLDVELTISPAGNVTQVKTGDGGLPGMKDCVVSTVKAWRFPASDDTTQTKFPLVFQPGG